MQKIIALTLLTLIINTNSAFAEEGFPLSLEPEVKPKNFSVNFFYVNSNTNDNKTAAHEFGGEIKAHFLNDIGAGPVGEIRYQYLLGTNPAIISGIVPPGDNAHMHDASALIGYKFPILEQLAVIPFLKGRAIITRGRGGDNLYGPEIGAGLEWKIYPETTHLNIRYGLMLPLFHNYTPVTPDKTDKFGPSTFLLNELEIKLSYRFLENWDITAGYQLRHFPKYQGNSNLVNKDLLVWNGLELGVAFVF
jgi:hypothetical protein